MLARTSQKRWAAAAAVAAVAAAAAAVVVAVVVAVVMPAPAKVMEWSLRTTEARSLAAVS
jgi:hypothetical protein